MSEHESFARVWLSELQSGTRVVVGGVSIEGAGTYEAYKINDAFDKVVNDRVKKAVDDFRDKLKELINSMPSEKGEK